jgi:glutamate--cysteine ligase
VPMYFIYRGGFVDVAGQSFRDFMKGKLAAAPGQAPTVADWEDHMSTAFPEARVKSYIELRGADSGPWARLCALPAFWAGLLYDDASLDAAWDLVKDWTADDRQALYTTVPKLALKARVKNRTVQEVALDLLQLSRAGLKRRKRFDPVGNDESGFLAPLQEIAETGITPAERMLTAYHGPWGGDVTQAYREHSYRGGDGADKGAIKS